jgi:hypothetical protein
MAKKYISGLVDPEVKEFVEKEAAADERSVSFVLNKLLSLGVHTYQKKESRKPVHAGA